MLSATTVLCVGLYDNAFTIILKLLCAEKFGLKNVASAGIDDYAHKEIPTSLSIKKACRDLGFILCHHTPVHPKTLTHATNNNCIAITHNPRHIYMCKDVSNFSLIATVYKNVYEYLRNRSDVNSHKLHLICSPAGINPTVTTAEAIVMMRSWIHKNY